MNLLYFIKKKIILPVGLLLTAVSVMAQVAPSPAANAPDSGSNLLEILLIITLVILAFVIWGLGQVLIELSRQLVKKSQNAPKVIAILLLAGLMLSGQNGFSQAATTSAASVSNYGGLSETTFYLFAAVVGVEVIAILFLSFTIRNIYRELMPKEVALKGSKTALGRWWANLDKKVFTKAVPIEREADYLLDHNYDGIQELDNALPPWWKYGFYITIAVACIYLLNFHVFGSGKNPTQEYEAEMEQAKIAKQAYEAKNKTTDNIDENNVPMADAAGLARAKEIFTTQCWPCHGKLGEGGAGPNLTDDYWLHKGSLNDIFHTIKYGYPDKGMQSWASVFSPKEISYLASYIKSLHGTNPPNAKAPQGDLYVEGTTPAAAPADSAKAATVK